MGRPINKKYFGNRNKTAIAGEGGGSLVTISGSNVTQAGAYLDALPAITSIGAPTLPGGEQAVGLAHSHASLAAVDVSGTGYQIGNIIVDANGSEWRVDTLVVKTVTKTANGTDYDNDNNIVFDSAGWQSALVLDVTSNTTGALGTFDVTSYGIWDGPGAAPLTLTATTANTRDGVDQNATGAAFTLTWGVASVSLVTSIEYVEGDSYSFGSLTTTGPGTGAKITVYYRLYSVVFSNAGSGYAGTESITLSAAPIGGTTASAVLVLNDRENAIIIHANIGNGTEIGDIVKQTNDRRYKVKTDYATKKCQLVGTDSLSFDSDKDVGEAYIQATDNNGNTYFVTRLTSRVATLEQWNQSGDWLFADGERAKWTFGATSPSVVKIENA